MWRELQAVALLLIGAAVPHGSDAQQLRGDANRRLDEAPPLKKCDQAPFKVERIYYETVTEAPNMFGWSVEPTGWTAFNEECWQYSFPMCGGIRQSPVKLIHTHRRLGTRQLSDSHDSHDSHGHEEHGHDEHGSDHHEDSHATHEDSHAPDHHEDSHASDHHEDSHADTHATDHHEDSHATDHHEDSHAPEPHGESHEDAHLPETHAETSHGSDHHEDPHGDSSHHEEDSHSHGHEEDSHSMGGHGGHSSSGSSTSKMGFAPATPSSMYLAVDEYFKSVRAETSEIFGSLTVGHETYVAKYIHLFAHGLHEVDSEAYDAEAFIVFFPVRDSHGYSHREGAWSPSPDGTMVVVSVLFKEGGHGSPLFSAMGLDDATWNKGSRQGKSIMDLAPGALGGDFFSYHGSLPVPPCWENVVYYVMESSESVSKSQLMSLRGVISAGRDAYRPIQRDVTQSSALEVEAKMTISCPSLIEKHGESVSQICWSELEQLGHGGPIESPVAIDSGEAAKEEAVPPFSLPHYHYQRLTASSERTPYGLKVLPTEGESFGKMFLNGHTYTAVSMSVHALGQHIINGKRYDGEIYIYHELYGDWFTSESHHPPHEHGRRLDAYRGNTRKGAPLPDVAGGPSTLLIVVVPLMLTTQPGSELLTFLQPHSTGTPPRAYASHDDLAAVFATGEFLQYKGSAMHPPYKAVDETFHYLVYSKPIYVNKDQLYTEAPTISAFDSTAEVVALGDRKVYGNYVPPAAMGTGKSCGSFTNNTWTYADEYCWGKIATTADGSPSYPECNGARQSPIHIKTSEVVDSGKMKPSFLKAVKYHPIGSLTAYNTGHAIEADDRMNGDKKMGMGYLQIGDRHFYFLRQFHVHFPSEHVIDGKVYAGELTIVHQKQDKWNGFWADDILVVAVLFEIGEASPLLEQLYLPYKEGFSYPKKMEYPFDMMRHIGPVLEGDWFRYQGSFTTPPCSEIVKWYVFKTPLTCSTEQFLAFKDITGFSNPANARSVQPLNGREVALNSWLAPGEEPPEDEYHEFYLNRDKGRSRKVMFPRSPWLVMWAVVGIAVLAVLTMLATFVREAPVRKAVSAGGLTAEAIGSSRNYNRL